MKLFHLSDLHIGLKLMNQDLSQDQAHILRQIVRLAGEHQPDAVVIAGDIYDKSVPPAEAVELFDEFIRELAQAADQAHLMLISGNHDSAARVNVFRSLLEKQRVHMIGMPPRRKEERIEQVTLEDAFGRVHFYLLPFVRPSMVREITGTRPDGSALSYDEALHALIGREQLIEGDRNVLVSHQFYLPAGTDAADVARMDSEICTVGNIDAVRSDVLERFDYAALGHIHKPMLVGGERWRYCGTPLACSVSEAGQEKGIVMVQLREKGTVQVQVLPLTPLRQVRELRGTLEEVLAQAGGDYVRITLTGQEGSGMGDATDRLRSAFPGLLQIRRESSRGISYEETRRDAEEGEKDPFALCCSFLKQPDAQEQALLRDVINTVKERNKG